MLFNYNADNFTEEQGYELLKRAAERRHNGRIIQHELNSLNEHMANMFDMADTFDSNQEQILIDYINSNPEQIDNIRAYVESQGYSPAVNLLDLCAQVAHARNEQIEQVVESYDADNFSFSSAAGRERRRARKAARRARRSGSVDMAADAPEQAQAEGQAAAPVEKPFYTVNDETQANVSNPLPPDGTNITRDEAHAEILGMEQEMQQYDGEQDEFLPVLNAAIALGTKTVQAVKEAKASGQKVDLRAFANLFKKKADEAAKMAMAGIESKKKKDFLRENAPALVIAALALVFIGSMIKG